MFYLKREREERAARAQRGGGARGGRSHVRPLGADLGADRHHRHVRHVPRGHPGDVGVRRGHDPGGRGRHARVADGPAGHALVARRSGRQRSRAVRQPASPRRRRGPHLGSDHRPRPPQTRRLGRPVGGLLLALAVPALQLRTVQAGVETFPQYLPVDPDLQPDPGGLPRGARSRPASSSRPTTSRAPAVQEAIGQLEWRALASGQMHEPITVDVNEAGTVATIAIPVDGKGMDATSEAALATLRDDIVPTTVGALAERRGRRDRDRPRSRRTSTTSSSRSLRSSSGSCSCSRSCSCCSRSARS